jgi:energy-coupling factor transporter ATP-binding protein EcfA2
MSEQEHFPRLTELRIQGYRGIKDSDVLRFAPLTVLVGPNGCGKSTVLDAAMLAVAASPRRALAVAAARRTQVNGASFLLHHASKFGALLSYKLGRNDVYAAIKLISSDIVFRFGINKSRNSDHLECEVDLQPNGEPISINPDDVFPARYTILKWRVIDVALRLSQSHGVLEESFTTVTEQGYTQDLIRIMTEVVPHLKDIRILLPRGKAVLYFEFAEQRPALPVSASSAGQQWLFHTACELAMSAGGLCLVEEPETHLHPAAMRLSAQLMHAAVENKAQIIMTTHSLEYIDALLSTATDAQRKNIAVIRTSLNDGKLVSSHFDSESLVAARESLEMDLR